MIGYQQSTNPSNAAPIRGDRTDHSSGISPLFDRSDVVQYEFKRTTAALRALTCLVHLLVSHRRTPTNVLKRKLMFSPSPNTSTKRRSFSMKNSASAQKKSVRIPKIIVSSEGMVPKGSKNNEKNSKKEISVSQISDGADTTYNQFKEHIEQRKELRSSLLNATMKGKARTPMRTPVKPLRKRIPVPLTPTATTPKLSHSQQHKSPRSPRLVQSTKLATVPDLPIIF